MPDAKGLNRLSAATSRDSARWRRRASSSRSSSRRPLTGWQFFAPLCRFGAGAAAHHARIAPPKGLHVPTFAMLLVPGMTQLDLTGPYEVFARCPGAQISLVWKNREPVVSDQGLAILPTAACGEVDAPARHEQHVGRARHQRATHRRLSAGLAWRACPAGQPSR